MKPIIEVNHLSKKYRYGESKPYYTLRESLVDFTKHPFGIGKTNGGLKKDEFWAVKDVSFKVNKGEAIGIIGPNGSGKSTLLKILSQITPPTSGDAILRGRVGSLLEVGTGFHQELTGRENIYLNGAILGMMRREINRKFDEIVDFSGVEKFLDTPVKHYSSGMYMRLAFAVAAHLDSEILLVDEVLAVGDTEFQKKCLGKMNDVTQNEGRTVLFVSHNMGAVKELCPNSIFLKEGKIQDYGSSEKMVDRYIGSSMNKHSTGSTSYKRDPFDRKKDLIKSVSLLGGSNGIYRSGSKLIIKVTTNKSIKKKFGIELIIKNSRYEKIAYASNWVNKNSRSYYDSGDMINIEIPKLRFVEDNYWIDVNCRIFPNIHVDRITEVINFSIVDSNLENINKPVSIEDSLGNVILDDVVFKP